METERMALRQRERDRLRVLHEVQQRHVAQIEAARRMKLTDRQVAILSHSSSRVPSPLSEFASRGSPVRSRSRPPTICLQFQCTCRMQSLLRRLTIAKCGLASGSKARRRGRQYPRKCYIGPTKAARCFRHPSGEEWVERSDAPRAPRFRGG